MGYRDDLLALTARHDALTADVRTAQRELDDATRLLAEARARSKLSVLDGMAVAAPCSADWKQLTGDDRVRTCGACTKNVYNLTEMTRVEAEALILAKEGKLCVRYFQRRDGTMLQKDCTIGGSERRRRRFIAVGVSAVLAVGVAVTRAPDASVLRADEVEAPAARRGAFVRVPFVERDVREVEKMLEGGYVGGAFISVAARAEAMERGKVSAPRSSPSSSAVPRSGRGSSR